MITLESWGGASHNGPADRRAERELLDRGEPLERRSARLSYSAVSTYSAAPSRQRRAF